MIDNKELLDDYIARNGLRHTVEREMMLEHIERIDCHFTPQELVATFGKTKHVSSASIYRNLKLFEEAGIVTAHNFPMRETVYEMTKRAMNHFHRVCTTCGEVKEFRDAEAMKILRRHRFRAFSLEGMNVYVYGTCKKCKLKKEQEKYEKSDIGAARAADGEHRTDGKKTDKIR